MKLINADWLAEQLSQESVNAISALDILKEGE